MITLITGQPGNGKTLRAMFLLEEEYKRNQAAVKEGKEEHRRFFTNITGAVVGEVYEVGGGKTVTNPDAFPWMERLPPHNDWTKLPFGSYIVYDEAHSDGVTPGLERYGVLFPATGKPGESSDPRVRAMSTHRSSFGMDIVLITQYPNKVHHQVRTLVGGHTHMNRAMGLAAAGMFSWSRVHTDPYDEDERQKGEEEFWKYDKSLYTRYISATHHTAAYKFKFPKKIKNGLITTSVLLLMGLGAFYGFGWNKYFFKADGAQPQAQGGEAPAAAAPSFVSSLRPSDKEEKPLLPGIGKYTWVDTVAASTLAGCVASAKNCRCFNSDGFVLDMDKRECRRVLEEPLPFNVKHKFESGRSSLASRSERGAGESPAQTAPPSVLIGGPQTMAPDAGNAAAPGAAP